MTQEHPAYKTYREVYLSVDPNTKEGRQQIDDALKAYREAVEEAK